ncbi:MAG: winged helix-turn-helix transcriptional regulator [Planctomycetes bacterium]|nr:winged helix-turn-helix transcriptional regulator [Planctomycetota bacterium]
MPEVVQFCRALADETRLRILNLIARQELCVCRIVDVLGLGQSKVSRHLAHLRNAGLVNDRRDGAWMYYSLAQPDGELHRRVVEWLRQAENEIPMAAADLAALESMGQCIDLCELSPSAEDTRRDDAAPVGSPPVARAAARAE